jgi:transposase-like protein
MISRCSSCPVEPGGARCLRPSSVRRRPEQRQVFRARIVLLAAEGRSTPSIARELGTMPRTVSGWRGRFAREGLAAA